MKNYYHILGLQNFSSLPEIRKAYRRLALKYHPDRGGDEEKMKELNTAYEFLNKNKVMYDNTLRPSKPSLKTYGLTIVVGGWDRTTNNSYTYTATI